MHYSLIIPVYNRPNEVNECLKSLISQTFKDFEIIIVEDGSNIRCEKIIKDYENFLDIKYFYKANSGPGLSRNYGAEKANGKYLIFCDSDCILPNIYFEEIDKALKTNATDFFGGPDKAHHSFTDFQKSINYAMTSFITTGGVRGNDKTALEFQPRSFNMGISKNAFIAVDGFGVIHPGEDPDLSIRLWRHGFESQYISSAFVYHKRKISWTKFYTQVNKFGLCRPILNYWYPETKKLTYWFPTCFIFGLISGISAALFYKNQIILSLYVIYFLIVIIDSCIKSKNIKIGLLSFFAVIIQFFGYGVGFFKSNIIIRLLKKTPEEAFPYLFYNNIDIIKN